MASKKKPVVRAATEADLSNARMLRLSDDLERRIRARQKQLRDDHGFEATFSATVRMLIEQGLKAQR